MKIVALYAALIVLGSTQMAAAHPGHHEGLSLSSMVDHFLTSPFHVLPIALGVVVLGFAGWQLRKAGKNSGN